MLLVALEGNDFILNFVTISLAVIIIGFLLRLIHQTHVIIYILTGIVVGPYVLGLVNDTEFVYSLGSLGLVLLLFFIGM
jgi:CPA2 family monovalent cation:H+ antiporter-2